MITKKTKHNSILERLDAIVFYTGEVRMLRRIIEASGTRETYAPHMIYASPKLVPVFDVKREVRKARPPRLPQPPPEPAPVPVRLMQRRQALAPAPAPSPAPVQTSQPSQTNGNIPPLVIYAGSTRNPMFQPYAGANPVFPNISWDTATARQGTLDFLDNTGIHQLKSIDGDLYFDTELLAKAGDIQQIADWALYPALADIDADNRKLTNVSQIDLPDGSLTTSTILEYQGQPVAARWSYSPALTDVNMSGFDLSSVKDLTAETVTAETCTLGPTGHTGTLSVSNLTDELLFDTKPVANLWSQSRATSTVDMFSNPIINANSLGLGVTGSNGVLTTNAGGTELYFNLAKVNTGDSSDWSTFPATTTVDIAGQTVENVQQLGIGATGSNGLLTTNPTGTQLFFNGTQINTGDSSDWSTFPATQAITGNVGVTDGLVVGNSSTILSTVADVATETYSLSDQITVDRGINVLAPALYSIRTQEGSFGKIQLSAGPSSTTLSGGLVDISAESYAGVSPTALSRVNMEGATVTISSGALGSLPIIPSCLNLQSILGGGITATTSAGPITLTSGTAIFMNAALNGIRMQSDMYANNVLNYSGQSVAIPDCTLTTVNKMAYGLRPLLEIYVSTDGSDTNGNGSITLPYKTIAKALTVRSSTISDLAEVAIVLSSGTFTETVNMTTNNTYLIGMASGGSVRQPVNVTGTITIAVGSTTAPSINMGLANFSLAGNVVVTGTVSVGGAYTISGVNIATSSGVSIAVSDAVPSNHQLIMTEVRINSGVGNAIGMTIDGGACQMINCTFQHTGTSQAITTSLDGSVTMRYCTVTNNNTTSTVLPLIQFNNSNTVTHNIWFSTLQYTSGTTDTVGNKCCIKFNASATQNALITQCFFSCVGAITASGGNIQCIQHTTASTVNLTYGGIQAQGTAHHIAPTITKTSLVLVP